MDLYIHPEIDNLLFLTLLIQLNRPHDLVNLLISEKATSKLIEYCEKRDILFIDKINAIAIVTKKRYCEMCTMTKKRKLWQKGCK